MSDPTARRRRLPALADPRAVHDRTRQTAETDRLAALLRRPQVDRGAASNLQAYVGSPVPVSGYSIPLLRRLVHESYARAPPRTTTELEQRARSLWRGSTTEERVAAIELLLRGRRLWAESTWRLVDGWVDRATGWGLSDGLAGGPVAEMVASRPVRLTQLERWARSPNPWRRRASLYALNRTIRRGELDRPFRLLDRLLDDPDRWVRRAAGTWLREAWKVDRPRTTSFLLAHVGRLVPEVVSIATERAPRTFRDRLRRLARSARDDGGASPGAGLGPRVGSGSGSARARRA